MDFLDWMRWAKSVESQNLIHFNMRNEIDFALDRKLKETEPDENTHLPDHIRKFAEYLKGIDESKVESALSNFIKDSQPDSVYGPALGKPRELAGIKAYGASFRQLSSRETAMLGLSGQVCDDALHEIRALIVAEKKKHPKNINISYHTRNRVSEIVDSRYTRSAAYPRSSGASICSAGKGWA